MARHVFEPPPSQHHPVEHVRQDQPNQTAPLPRTFAFNLVVLGMIPGTLIVLNWLVEAAPIVPWRAALRSPP
jgi:hypothetical protein